MKKHIFIPTALIVATIGGLFLAGMILGKMLSRPKEQGYEKIQNPIPKNISEAKRSLVPVTQGVKGSYVPHGNSTVRTSTSAIVFDSHQDVSEETSFPQPKGDSSEEKELVFNEKTVLDEKMFLDEKGEVIDWEKWCLARMQRHGWFEPEDIPIVYGDPGGVTDGVYIWRVDYGRLGQVAIEPPEHVKARTREIREELRRITDLGDMADKEEAKKFFRLSQELAELNSPYQGGWAVLNMHVGNVPPSWRSYFDVIFAIESEKFNRQVEMQIRQAQPR